MGHRKEQKKEREPQPVLSLRNAKLKAVQVEEREERTWTSEEGETIVFKPEVNIWWEILDDGKQGKHNGVRFFDPYRFVKAFEGNGYVVRDGTRIGDLAAFLAYELQDGADYFDDDVEVNFEDLEGLEVGAKLEPRVNPTTKQRTGTMTDSATLRLIRDPARDDVEELEEEIEPDLTEAQERQMEEAFGAGDDEDAA